MCHSSIFHINKSKFFYLLSTISVWALLRLPHYRLRRKWFRVSLESLCSSSDFGDGSSTGHKNKHRTSGSPGENGQLILNIEWQKLQGETTCFFNSSDRAINGVAVRQSILIAGTTDRHHCGSAVAELLVQSSGRVALSPYHQSSAHGGFPSIGEGKLRENCPENFCLAIWFIEFDHFFFRELVCQYSVRCLAGYVW